MEIRLVLGKDWDGSEEMIQEAIDAIKPDVERRLKSFLLYAEGELKNTLTGPRTGRSYKVSKTGKLHVASAPGEPPAVLFGNLRNSVGHSGPTWSGDTVSGEFGPGLGTRPADPSVDPMTYAVRLEFGGIDSRGVKIEARPYMAPTELKVRPVLDRMFEDL